MAGIKIIGLGKASGDVTVTNDDLAKIVDTSDSWIREKSGIRTRYFAREKSNADMAAEAAAMAVKHAGIAAEEIAVCIVCTFTPDDYTPATACSVCGRLGLPEEVLALDLNGACAGFIYGCHLANGLLASQPEKYGRQSNLRPFWRRRGSGSCSVGTDGGVFFSRRLRAGQRGASLSAGQLH